MKKTLLFPLLVFATTAMAQVYPFSDDYESYTNFTTLGTQGGYKSDMSVYQTHGMGNSPKGLVSQISTFNTRDTLVSPLIGQVGAAAQLSFHYRIINTSLYPSTPTTLGTGDAIEVYAGIEAIGAYQLMYTINNGNHVVDTAFKKVTINIPGTFVGQTGNFKFVVKKGTATDYWVDIDSLRFGDSTAVVALPISLVTDSTAALCFGSCSGSVGVTATGGDGNFTYVWSNNLGTTPTVQNVCGGNYTVTVTDGLGATATATVTVPQPAPLVLSSTITPVTCYGLSDGCLDMNVTGGTAPYDYIWSNGATTEVNCNLAASSHDVTVLDGNNCTAATNYIVTEPSLLTAFYDSIPPSTFGGNDGSILVTITGGAGSGVVSFNGGAFSSNSVFSNLAAGCYSIVIKDQNNCTVGPDTVCLVNPPSGILQSENEKVSIYPNPASGFLVLKTNGLSGEVSLLNMLGESVLTQPVSGIETRIETAHLPKGSYTLALKIETVVLRKSVSLQ